MVSLSEQTKNTAGELLSIVNNKPKNDMIGPSSSAYDLLFAIFKIMVKREQYKVQQDNMDDDSNDQRHFKRDERHNEILEALGAKPGKHIPQKEKEQLDLKKLDFKKYLKKFKLKEPKFSKKITQTPETPPKGFSLGNIAKIGTAVAAVGIIGAGAIGGKSALATVIGKGESFGGDPTAYNTRKGKSYVSGRGATVEGRTITEMRVGNIRKLQEEGKIFAVGKYQMTPSTLQMAINAGKINLNDIFDEDAQNKLFNFLIEKRPLAKRYLDGDTSVSTQTAVEEIAKEWAAVGVPRDMKGAVKMVKKGESYYSGVGGNKAFITPESVAEALEKDRMIMSASKIKPFEGINQPSMSLENISRENSLINEQMTGTPPQSSVTNNYNVGLTEKRQNSTTDVEDDRSSYQRKSYLK